MNRTLFFLGLIFAVLFPVSPVHAQQTVELDLAGALARARDANFAILIERENVESLRQSARRARAELLPQVTATAAQSRAMQPNVGGFTEGIEGIPDRRFTNRFDALLRARLSTLDATRIAEYRVAQYDAELSTFDLESTVQDILEAIADAFFTHVRNLARLDVIAANIERDRALLELSENQFEAGVATPIDVTRAEVQLSQNELALLQQETLVFESELRIKRILNINLGADLRVVPPPLSEAAIDSAQAIGLQAVLRDNSDYQRATRTLERNEYARRATNWERLPSLELTGEWGYAARSLTSDMREQWRIQAGISVPIFEGFRIQTNQLRADAAIRRQEFVIADLENELDADLRLARQDLRSRFSQIAIARKQLELSERELELARTRFEEGVADNRDVVSAQANVAAAEDGVVEAEYFYNRARLRLARVSGDVSRLAGNN
ncbi:MAG: TolC family protein [Opitutales bacterium]|nr:TolC family protein [Opitutales bacterium]